MARVRQLFSRAQNDILTNTASFTSTGTAAKKATADVQYVVPEPKIVKTVNDGGKPVTAGQTLTYTLTATNPTGRPTSFDTVVTDCIPAALTNVSGRTLSQGSGVISPNAWCGQRKQARLDGRRHRGRRNQDPHLHRRGLSGGRGWSCIHEQGRARRICPRQSRGRRSAPVGADQRGGGNRHGRKREDRQDSHAEGLQRPR